MVQIKSDPQNASAETIKMLQRCLQRIFVNINATLLGQHKEGKTMYSRRVQMTAGHIEITADAFAPPCAVIHRTL